MSPSPRKEMPAGYSALAAAASAAEGHKEAAPEEDAGTENGAGISAPPVVSVDSAGERVQERARHRESSEQASALTPLTPAIPTATTRLCEEPLDLEEVERVLAGDAMTVMAYTGRMAHMQRTELEQQSSGTPHDPRDQLAEQEAAGAGRAAGRSVLGDEGESMLSPGARSLSKTPLTPPRRAEPAKTWGFEPPRDKVDYGEILAKARTAGWGAEALHYGIDTSEPRGPTLQACPVEPEKVTRVVVVTVVRATDLLSADANGMSDPFATVQLDGAIGEKRKRVNKGGLSYISVDAVTSTQKSTLNPVWEEQFRIPVTGRVGQLKIQVFDYDVVGDNDFLGLGSVSLHMLRPLQGDDEGEPNPEEVNEKWLQLRGKTEMGPATGAVHIRYWMEIEYPYHVDFHVELPCTAEDFTGTDRKERKDADGQELEEEQAPKGKQAAFKEAIAATARNIQDSFVIKPKHVKICAVVPMTQKRTNKKQPVVSVRVDVSISVPDKEVGESLKSTLSRDALNGQLDLRIGHMINNEPKPEVKGQPTKGLSKKERKRREAERLMDPDEIKDQILFLNLPPSMSDDARKIKMQKKADEKARKQRAKALALSRGRQQQLLRLHSNRPRWKEWAWRKWEKAGNRFHAMAEYCMETWEAVKQSYKDMGDLAHVDKNSLALRSAQVHHITTKEEVIGWTIMVALLMAGFIGSLYIWVRDFAEPLSTYLLAECLAISSQQTEKPRGFGLDPLKRAEVLVHVFSSSMPECCCADRDGKQRCDEWQTIAYDAVNREHSSGSKEHFLVKHGHPGTFYPCWHSSDKQWVVLSRNYNSEFLWVPILALVFMCISAYQCYCKIKGYRAVSRHYHRIHDIVHTDRGLVPEDAWIYEDADFRPHPKQQFELRQMFDEDLPSSSLHASKVKSDDDGRLSCSDEEFPVPPNPTLHEMMMRPQEEVEEEDCDDEGRLLQVWYHVQPPIRGLLWRHNLLWQDKQFHNAEVKKWYTFVIFDDGGDTALTEIKLKSGHQRAKWADMKAHLIRKLGSAGLLGVARDHHWDNKTYCLRYIDPYQKPERKLAGKVYIYSHIQTHTQAALLVALQYPIHMYEYICTCIYIHRFS